MEAPSSPSSIITAPPDCHERALRLAKLTAEAMTCDFALLHYDSVSKSMIEWCWPNDDGGNKVLLSDFEKYRKEHEFQYPCCLCAEEGGRGTYTEAAVYSWRDKTTDETCWNARCASDQCGYQGQCSSFLRRPKTNYHLHKEPRPILLEWTYSEQTELMKTLQSAVGGGITENEFRVLFKRCKHCMRVGTRPSMKRHIQGCSGGVQKRQAKSLVGIEIRLRYR
ncbi:hypothetical protein P692DRAFT_20737514 [Suillus brevipes Sb2]|nr:hypothetical protein P692DRAFT_20737514 [Suillus brevipes Sb2]